MAVKNILRNLNLFIEGRSYAGQVSNYTPPSLALVTEEYRAGGMDAAVDIDVGMEKMQAEYSITGYDTDAIERFGLKKGETTGVSVRGALESADGEIKPIVHTLRGKIVSVERESWAPGEASPLKFSHSLTYFKEEIDGKVTTEIDVENMKRIIGGVDQLEDKRAALGI